jgi:hypothetical protein
MTDGFRPGDYYVRCDRSGQKRLRSECVRQWDGLIVAREYAESRHPLDLQRPPPIERVPRETRPDVDPIYLPVTQYLDGTWILDGDRVLGA